MVQQQAIVVGAGIGGLAAAGALRRAGWLAHRRGRVAGEERSPLLPGWLWRQVWRRTQPAVRRRYAAHQPPASQWAQEPT